MITGTLRPLGDRLIVRPDNDEKSTTIKSSLIIPDSAKEKPLLGTVLAVGPGKRLNSGKLLPVDVKVGNKVYYGKFAGIETKLNDDDVLIIHEDEILGVVE